MIYIAKDGKVVTSTNKPYNNKDQLTTANATLSGGKVSTAAADVLVVTAVTNADGSISFKTADGKFLHSDGTNTNLVAEENDNTKFILEETTGGYFIKLATFKYQGTRDQYLEYYASSLTSFGMGDDTAAFTFAFYELGNGTSEPVDPPASGTTATIVDAPEVETAYKLGMKIASGKTVYFNGNTDGKDYWLQTTENVAEAVDVKLASVDGGYHLYFMKDGTKTYIRVTTYVNNSGSTSGTLELTTTAPTEVLTFEETIKTLIYTAEESYYMGTYQNYDNISTSGLFRITGDNASALDTTQFPARLYTVEIGEPGTTEPDTTEPGTTEPSGDGSYVKITDASQFTSGQYVMIVDTGYAPGVVDGTWLTAVQPVVSGNTVTDAKGGVWTLTVNGSSVVIADSTGAAIGPKGDNANGLSAGSYDWAWSFADGKFQFAGTGEDTVVLASNATTTGQYPGNHRFRGYKTTTVTGQYASDYPCDFTLYKLDGEGGGSGTETIPPTGPTTTPTEPETTEPSDISSISEALAASSGTFTVKGVVTAVDSSNIYLQDATGAICVRMSAKPTDISLGDTIIGTGSRADYYGMPQLGSGTYEKSSGMTLSAKTTTIGALTTADICTYVKLTGLEVTEYYDNNGAYTNPNITVQDSEGNTIQIYKAVVSGVYNVGDIIDVTAAVGYYNKFQLRNTVASEITLSDGTGGGSTEPTEPEPTEPGTTSDVTITFADLAKGEQYVAENRDLGNGITIETNDGCQITTQLRIYQDDDGHDGKPVFTCSQVIRKLVLNAGYKDGASLDVYGSTDGTNWVKITTISGLTSAYADYTVEMPAGTSYKYLKLDAIDKQVRLPYITFTFDD